MGYNELFFGYRSPWKGLVNCSWSRYKDLLLCIKFGNIEYISNPFWNFVYFYHCKRIIQEISRMVLDIEEDLLLVW